MKTKQVPIIIALIAGLTICIIGFVTQMETGQFRSEERRVGKEC